MGTNPSPAPGPRASGWLQGLLCVIAVTAIVCACSTQDRSTVPTANAPFGGELYRTSPSGSGPLRLRIGHRRRHRIKPFGWPPPGIVTGSKPGTYCYLTGLPGPIGPNWYPVYKCWIVTGDMVDFGTLQQTIGYGETSGWYCSQTDWWSGVTGGPLDVEINPHITGPGSWQCNRTDYADVTMQQVGTDTGHWTAGGTVNGNYTLCSTFPFVNCDYPAWVIILQLDVNPGPAPSPYPTPIPTSIGSPYPSPAPTLALQIYDNRLARVVSGGLATASPMPSSVIGLENNLTAVMSNGQQPTTVSWNEVSGQPVSSQTTINQPAVTTQALSLPSSANPLDFFWTQASTTNTGVFVTGTYNNQNYAALAAYNVEGPSLTSMSASVNQPSIVQRGSAPTFQLGNLDPPNGIVSTYMATAPQDFNGWVAENQQILNSDSVVPSSVPFPDTTTPPDTFWTDGCWIMNVNANVVNQGPVSAPKGTNVTYGPTYDSPYYTLNWPGVTQWNINDTFNDYFMYRPRRSGWNAVWVNFGFLAWAWGGTAALTSGGGGGLTWQLSGGFGHVTMVGQANSSLVGWSAIFPPPQGYVCTAGPTVIPQSHGHTKIRMRPTFKRTPPRVMQRD